MVELRLDPELRACGVPSGGHRVQRRNLSCEEELLTQTRDQRNHDDEKEDPDKFAAFQDGHLRAGQRAGHVAQRHWQGGFVDDVMRSGEVGHAGKIGGPVHRFGRRGRGKKVEPEQAHEHENQKTAGAGTKKTIVKPEAGPDQNSEPARFAARVFRLVNQPEILPYENIKRDEDEQRENDWTKKGRIQPRDGEGSEKRKNRGDQCRRPNEVPVDLDALRVARDGQTGPGQRRHFIRAEDGRNRDARHEEEQRRDLNQAATADDGIDEARQQRGGTEQKCCRHRGSGSSISARA